MSVRSTSSFEEFSQISVACSVVTVTRPMEGMFMRGQFKARRGTSIAAAALSFALVAPLAQPVAFAQEAQEAPAAVAGAETPDSNGAIPADAIANGYITGNTSMTNAKSTLSGRAFIDDGYGLGPTDAGQQPVPEGTKVYMQWIDTDGAVSPVYVAQTSNQLSGDKTAQAGPGAYAFDLRKPWVDHHGKEHVYTASTNQYYKLWINPFVDERNGFTVYPFRQLGGFFPGSFRNSMGADQQGAFNLIGTNMQRTAVLMQADRDVPYMHKPKSEWVEDKSPTVTSQSVSSSMTGHVGGYVWHETKDARVNGPNSVGDVPAKDMYVVMSVLTEEGAGAYAAAVDTLPEAQKLAAARKLLEEHPEYIAQTVRSKTNADGLYSVKFPDRVTESSFTITVLNPDPQNGRDRVVVAGQKMKDIDISSADSKETVSIAEDKLPEGVKLSRNGKVLSGTPVVKDWQEGEAERKFEIKRTVTAPGEAVDPAAGEAAEPPADKVTESSFTITVLNPAALPKKNDRDRTVVAGQKMEDIEIAAENAGDTATINKETLPEGVKLAWSDKWLSGTPVVNDWKEGETERTFEIKRTVTTPHWALTNKTKQYLYAHVETADGKIPSGYSAWRVPLFNSPQNNGTRNPAPIAAENPVQNPMWYNVNFALVPRHHVTLDITNFNMTDKTADIGGTAKLNVTGPFPVTPNKIVWKKNNRETVKTCDIGSVKEANACELTVPEDAKTGDIYTAEFVTGDDTVLAADSFTVVVPVVAPFGSVYDKYAEFDTATVLPKEPANKVEGKDPVFKAENLPDGLKLDENGKLSGTPTKAGTTEVIVTREVTAKVTVDVPVVDKDGNPEYVNPEAAEKDRVPKTEPKEFEEVQRHRVPMLLTVTDSPLAKGTVGEKYTHKVVPTGFEDHPHKLVLKEGTLDVQGLPKGLTFNKETGEITGTPEESVKADEEQPNVTVTYTLVAEKAPASGRKKGPVEYKVTDRVPLPVMSLAEAIEPEYEGKLVTPEKPTTSKPIFKKQDENGQPTDETVTTPAKSKFKIGTTDDGKPFEAPKGYKVDIDGNSGEITVTVDQKQIDKDTVEEFEVPVVVEYPDKSTDTTKAKFELDTDNDGTPDSKDDDDDGDGVPDDQEKDKGSNPKDKGSIPWTDLVIPGASSAIPSYEEKDGQPGTTVNVDKPKFKDANGKETEAPEGAKFVPNGELPDGVTLNPDGSITVKVPADQKTGEPIEVPVTVEYPDGSKRNVTAKVNVKDTIPPTIDKVRSSDKTVTVRGDRPGEKIIVEFPDGTTGEGVTDENKIAKIEVPGSVKLKNGDKINAKDGDGNPAEEVTVGASDAEHFSPSYDAENTRTGVKIGESKDTANPFGGEEAPVEKVEAVTPETAKGWNIAPKADAPTSGVLTGQAPTQDVLKGEFDELAKTDEYKNASTEKTNKDEAGNDVSPRWQAFVKAFTPIARPETDVTFTYKDGTIDEAKAKWDLLGQDGKSILDPNGDADGDGVSNQDEINGDSDPFDKDDVPSHTTVDDSNVTPVDPNGEEQGTGVIIKDKDDKTPTDVTVTDKNGNPVPHTIDPDTGEIKVTPPEGTEGPLKVVITDKDLPEGETTVEVPVKPGLITNETDEVPAGKGPKKLDDKVVNPTPDMTGEVDGIPGAEVEVDPDTGEITVTIPSDATPGEKTVTIKDKDGNPVGTSTIVVTDKTAPVIDELKSNADKVTGKGDRPGESITVTFPDGKTVTVETKEDKTFEVEIPEGTTLHNGDVIKAKDGNNNESSRVVGASDADTFTPSYGPEDTRTGVEVGKSEDSADPFGGKDAPVKAFDVDTPKTAKYWTFTKKDETSGVVTGQAPTNEALAGEFRTFESELKKEGKKVTWDGFTARFQEIAQPTTKVTFTYDDGSSNSADAGWDLLGQDGKSILDKHGDADGDGVSNEDEVNKGTNPFDKGDKPSDDSDAVATPAIDDVHEGDDAISGTGEPGSKVTVTHDGEKIGEGVVGQDGKWKVKVSGDSLKQGKTVKVTQVTDGSGTKTAETQVQGPREGDSNKDNTPPVVNPIKPGDKTISGKGDRPGEDIIVTLPGGKKVPAKTDKDGNWKVDVPADVELKPGQDVVVEDGAGNKTTEKVGIDTGKCVASAVGFGLPLIALLPLGLASQIQIPVLSDMAAQVDAQLKAVNTRIQQQAGIFNPELAAQVERINAQLRTVGADLGMVAAGIVLIAAGILAGTVIYDNCNPGGPKSSVKDLELQGSSGSKVKLSSGEKGEKATKPAKEAPSTK